MECLIRSYDKLLTAARFVYAFVLCFMKQREVYPAEGDTGIPTKKDSLVVAWHIFFILNCGVF